MNGNILPLGCTPLVDGRQYIGLQIPGDGRYLIARKTVTPESSRFEYAVFQDEVAFVLGWADMVSQNYQPRIGVIDANLAVLVNQLGGQPTVVQMAATDKTIPQHVIVDNRAAEQPVRITTTDHPLPVVFDAPAQYALTNDQLRAAPLPVTVSNPTPAPETGLAKDATLTSGGQKTQVTNLAGLATVQAQAALQASVDTLNANVLTVKAQTANLDVALSTRTKPADAQKVDGSGVTQPVSVAGTVNTGLTQPLTDVQLRANPLHVVVDSQAAASPDVTDRAARQLGHVTVDGSALPVGAATEATLLGVKAALTTPAGQVRLAVFSPAGSQALTLVRTGAVILNRLHASNVTTTPRVLAFYNKATAPVVGDVPVLSVVVPPGSSYRLDGLADAFPLGLGYSIGTQQGALTALAATVLTSLNAGDLFFALYYV